MKLNTITRIKIVVVMLFVAGVCAFLFTDNSANRSVHAFSSGPPAGYTRAPGELDCSECHLIGDPGTGRVQISAPANYVPGQSYLITVNQSNPDPTRVRWGFQLTALDAADERAGNLESLDALTQVLVNQGPFPSRQYVEHTQAGTFSGQRNEVNWTFRWTAPTSDVGPVVFYVAGNQANGDGNSSGDNVYFTFATALPAPATEDFSVTVSPAARTVTQGDSTTYTVTVAPLNNFKGTVALSLSGLPSGASATFQPPSLDFNDATPKSATINLSTTPGTTKGSHTLKFEAGSGSLVRSAQAELRVIGQNDADLWLTQAVSPNPGQVNSNMRFTYTVRNNGPAASTQTSLRITLPANAGALTPGAGACSMATAGSELTYTCALGTLQPGGSAAIDFTLRPTSPGVVDVTALASATESDPFGSDNSVTASIPVAPASAGPQMTVSNLGVRTVVTGLELPTGMAFIGANDFLVLEKNTGRVKRVVNGLAVGTVLDLHVNNASERGLLGIALHPNFAANNFVYIFWTESSTGADTSAVDEVALLGNRVDRYVWNGSSLAHDRNIVRLRAHQPDAGQPSRGNHNGGVLRFGPDGKLYVMFGDVGRRGLLQNITSGGPVPDDQFGGPEPDDAHLSGVVLRLNDDGTTPTDNPFFNADAGLAGEAAANVKKIFAYGIRNSFGMDFDPVSGALWMQENGDDAFDEINRVEAGFNGGWIQLMGPSSRVAEFKAIEVARGNSLQQNRWPPTLIADTPGEALARLYRLPGSLYTEPAFSWKYAVAPSPLGFARGGGLGAQYANDLFVGASRTTLLGGYLFRFKLSGDRKSLALGDPRLSDLVADNSDKFDLAESESLVVGRDFGVTTDIQTSPAGSLYVVSLSNGAVYEIFAKPTLFVANLDGAQEVPPNASKARGTATILLNSDETSALVSLRFRDLTTAQTAAHIHGPAATGASAPPLFDLPAGAFTDFRIALTPQQVSDLKAGLFYINVHSAQHPAGEIRGQFGAVNSPAVVAFDLDGSSVDEGAGAKTVNVVRMGDASGEATVDYATSDGTASERSDYTTARGTLRFGAGERVKSFALIITDDALQEQDETINLTLSNPTGALALAPQSALVINVKDDDASPSAANPIDDSSFFVRQHYADFLNRVPDQAGLVFWRDQIESCGTNLACRDDRRVNVSAAFFLSIEFQETGYLVYLLEEASFDRQPRYHPFIADTREIGEGVVVGADGWEVKLASNRSQFVERWTTRPAFKSVFDPLTNAQYVDKLFANAGLSPTSAERDALVAALDAGSKTRARVLLDVAEREDFRRAEFNRAFVLMQYFGYLRRNPDDPPDNDRAGYDFWLRKLNDHKGNFISAEMVKSFLVSTEYRARFGKP